MTYQMLIHFPSVTCFAELEPVRRALEARFNCIFFCNWLGDKSFVIVPEGGLWSRHDHIREMFRVRIESALGEITELPYEFILYENYDRPKLEGE